MRGGFAFATLTTCISREVRFVKASLFKQLLVSIAALVSAACTSTTDGLQLENREQPAAVASNGHHDATSCHCSPASCSTGTEGSSEGKCQMTDGMMSRHASSPAVAVEQK